MFISHHFGIYPFLFASLTSRSIVAREYLEVDVQYIPYVREAYMRMCNFEGTDATNGHETDMRHGE